MNGRFWVFGIIVSVLVHAAGLLVLSLSSSGSSPEPESAPAVQPEPAASESVTTDPASADPVPALTPAETVANHPSPAAHPTATRPKPRSVTLPDAHPAPAHEPAPTPATEWATYTVKRGDMLERLCKKAGCSVSEAARYNKTTYKKLSNLKVGQKIKLPKFKEN